MSLYVLARRFSFSWSRARSLGDVTGKGVNSPLVLSQRRLLSSNRQEDGEDTTPSGNTTREYISKTPELQKLLADLYEDYKDIQETRADDEKKLKGSMAADFEEYRDEDGPVIFDVDEEREILRKLEEQNIHGVDLDTMRQTKKNKRKTQNISDKVGSRGVFEVDELVSLLLSEGCYEPCVIRVRPELGYVDYMVLVTTKSSRHVSAVAEFVSKVYKMKVKRKDGLILEGHKKTQNWIAVDIGNIALHIFTRQMRQKYDIETLWTVGSEFDDLTNKTTIDDTGLSEDWLADIKPL